MEGIVDADKAMKLMTNGRVQSLSEKEEGRVIAAEWKKKKSLEVWWT